MKNTIFASLPSVVLGVIIVIAPQTFAHACNGHSMLGACHYSQQAATGIGIVIALLGIISFFVSRPVRVGINIAVALDALLLLAVPYTLIGICKGQMMHCRMVMLPTLTVLGVLALVCAVTAVWIESRSKTA